MIIFIKVILQSKNITTNYKLSIINKIKLFKINQLKLNS
jgi:hypothetical protein